MEVQVISKKFVKPSIPTPSYLRRMSLSSLDQVAPQRTVPVIFYFSANGNYRPDSIEHVERLKRLEKSLSETLALYYPVAGRYIKENQLIHCNDEGVSYVEALVNGQISQILREDVEPKELNQFVPDEADQESATSPLVAIQISIFSCGGLTIGLRTSHRIVDGFTFLMFINRWAKTSKGIKDVTVPNFVTNTLFPPRDLSRYKLPTLSETDTDQVVTKRFVLDANAICKLKADQARRLNYKVSTMEVLTALLWMARINAARARYGHLRTSLFSIIMTLRGKKLKLIPENCCGNLVTRINARFDQENASKMGLNDFVDRVTGAIRNSILECAEQIQGDEDEFFSKVIMEPYRETLEIMNGGGDLCIFSSLKNFPVYELDFGWGKPAWVSFTQRPYKGVMFLDARDGVGTEAWVTLEVNEMAYFQNDPYVVMLMKRRSSGTDGNIPIPRPNM